MDISEGMKACGWAYREPCKVDKDSPEYLKQKHELAKQLLKEAITIKPWKEEHENRQEEKA